MRWFSITLILICCSTSGFTQVVYQDVNKTSIYIFLDEMANQQFIELNTFSKPYSRELIARKLAEIDTTNLNERQKKELSFFLKDFNKELKSDKQFDKRYDLFYYKDSLFSITVNPALGGEYKVNENRFNWRRWYGAEVFGTIGKNVGYYVNLRDYTQDSISQNENFLNTNRGANHKSNGDFSDLRGGLFYNWNWGAIGILKDNFTWGNNNYGANIYANKAPSFARIELNVKPVKWLDFKYFHGWLASEVRDSSRSYLAGARKRNVDVRKYIASNALTIRPIKRLNITVGNSIIYSDNLQPGFFIPFMFFKAIDHSVYAGSGNFGGANTQLFLDISSRNIKNIHLYSTLFVDEISFSRLTDPNQHSNFVSGKFGAQWSNIFNQNLELTAEYTATNPVTYDHFVNTTTFESNNYNLGHYLRGNAQEIGFRVRFKPISQLRIEAEYILAEKGREYRYTGTGTAIWGLPFMSETRWASSSFSTGVIYEAFNDVNLFANYTYSDVNGKDLPGYTAKMFHGITNTIMVGANIGF